MAMPTWLDVESYFTGSIFVLVFVFCSVAGVGLVRRWFELDRLRHVHDVSGNMFSVGGTLYAVLLGLIVVDAMQTFQMARQTVEKEANALANVYLLAQRLPPQPAARLQSLCRSYAHEVIEREWPMMDAGQVHEAVRNISLQLVNEATQLEPVTENQKALYPSLVQETLELRDERRARTGIALHDLPAVEWFVLCVGAVITVVFSYVFHVESYRLQLMMVGMVALLIGLNLYLVVLFSRPFSGDLHVDAEPLVRNLMLFDGIGDALLRRD